jgi:hypothetical protein
MIGFHVLLEQQVFNFKKNHDYHRDGKHPPENDLYPFGRGDFFMILLHLPSFYRKNNGTKVKQAL